MKKFFKTIIIMVVTIVSFYHFRSVISEQAITEIKTVFVNIKNKLNLSVDNLPCSKPIEYSLGTFDTQFKISKSDFEDAFLEAEAIWEKPYGKDLFMYTTNDSTLDILKINLVYDYRQKATNILAQLGIVAENNLSSYKSLENKLKKIKKEYKNDEIVFNTTVATFNKKQLEYSNNVKYWNSVGGASQEEFNKLESVRTALEDETIQLKSKQIKLTQKIEEINSLVVVLNRLVNTLNLSVKKYNTINESRGESFEEGLYSSDGKITKIDIYEFSSHKKLVRVLAHELGHALGLEHVPDTKAIMYKLNQGNSTALTTADLNALKIKCGVE